MTENTEALRYVRLRCPLCDMTSPTCDQKVDVRRSSLHAWWDQHQRSHRVVPTIELAPQVGVAR